MRVIVKTTEPVLLSYVETLLTDAAIAYHVADRQISSVDALISAFPMRVLVADEDCDAAIAVLREADLGDALATA
jgi:Putative prokaryotic signal transducing protein